MSNIDFLRNEIFSRYGTVKRARGCFLYTAKGVRLTDMYQEGGRAILGWGGGSAFTMLKNVLNRGVTGSFKTDFEYRVKKACSELFNSEREVFFFYSKEEALKCALSFSAKNTSVYMPWSPNETNWAEIDAIVFAPALPWCESIYIAAVKKECISDDLPVPVSRRLPAPLLTAVTRSVYDLIVEIQLRQEKDWFIYDSVLTTYWERKGPYLFPKVPEEMYDDFIIHCLDLNIVISPEYNVPSIVPFGADKGNFTALKNKPFVF